MSERKGKVSGGKQGVEEEGREVRRQERCGRPHISQQEQVQAKYPNDDEATHLVPRSTPTFFDSVIQNPYIQSCLYPYSIFHQHFHLLNLSRSPSNIFQTGVKLRRSSSSVFFFACFVDHHRPDFNTRMWGILCFDGA